MTFKDTQTIVAPVWGRGLKFYLWRSLLGSYAVAPVWGRGLKLVDQFGQGSHQESPPYGGVD